MRRILVPFVDGRPELEADASFDDLRLSRTKAGRSIPRGQCEVRVREAPLRPAPRLQELEERLERLTIALDASSDGKLKELADAVRKRTPDRKERLP